MKEFIKYVCSYKKTKKLLSEKDKLIASLQSKLGKVNKKLSDLKGVLAAEQPTLSLGSYSITMHALLRWLERGKGKNTAKLVAQLKTEFNNNRDKFVIKGNTVVTYIDAQKE